MEFFGEEAFAGVATPKRNMLSESDGAAAAGGGHGLPDVPSESMTRAEREDWVRKAKKAMTAEQRLLLAGVTPAKLVAETEEFDLTTIPPIVAKSDGSNATAVANREALRAKAQAENDKNAEYREARLRELRHELAEQLEAAFDRRARLAWQALAQGHAVTSHPGMVNGAAAFNEFAQVEEAPGNHSIFTQEQAKQQLQALEAAPLHDGCTADDVANRFNAMVRDINPFLLEKKTDKSLCRWMIDGMPPSCFTLVEMAEVRMKAAGDLEKPAIVQKEMMEAAEKTYRQLTKIGGYAAMAASGIACKQAAPFAAAQRGGVLGPGLFVGAAAPVVGVAPGAGWSTKPGFKTLPPGQRCPEGTCNLDHKGRCWSSAHNTDLSVSPAVWADKTLMARLEAARQRHASAAGVKYTKLKPPKKKEAKESRRKKAEKKKAAAAAAAATAAGGAREAGLFVDEAGAFMGDVNGLSDEDESSEDDEEYEYDRDQAEQMLAARDAGAFPGLDGSAGRDESTNGSGGAAAPLSASESEVKAAPNDPGAGLVGTGAASTASEASGSTACSSRRAARTRRARTA